MSLFGVFTGLSVYRLSGGTHSAPGTRMRSLGPGGRDGVVCGLGVPVSDGLVVVVLVRAEYIEGHQGRTLGVSTSRDFHLNESFPPVK